MAEDDSDTGDAMDRLERALARIAARANRTDPEPAVAPAEVAARLDAVIARLRAELEG